MATRTEMTKDHFKCAIWDESSILDTLVNEAMELKEKIENARKREDYGTYKNLILAFKEIVNLIHEEKEKTKWVDMYSHYKMKIDEEFQEVISTWKQRGDDVSEHKIYKVEKEITDKPTYNLYFDISTNNTMKEHPSTIYYKDKIYYNYGNIEQISKYIIDIIGKDKVKIYGDTRTFGMGVYDYLKDIGFDVQPIELGNSK